MVTICIACFLSMTRHIGFQNGRHLKSTLSIIFRSNGAIDSILVSKCMFWGAWNPMVTIRIAYFLPISRHIGFQNGCPLKSTFSIIFRPNAAIDLILMSKFMFWRKGIWWLQSALMVYLYKLATILDFKMTPLEFYLCDYLWVKYFDSIWQYFLVSIFQNDILYYRTPLNSWEINIHHHVF